MMEASTQPLTSTIPAYKSAFLQACVSANVLTFGTYTLKSGRQSPYFFNTGSFHTPGLLDAISTAFAQSIISFFSSHPSISKSDIIFGPAYKGIPLASFALHGLWRLDPQTWSSVSYSSIRKEAKDRGEGGDLLGGSLRGKTVLVIDDVVTAGTAMRETMTSVAKEGGKIMGFVVVLDRTATMSGPGADDGEPRMSAMGQIGREFGVPTASIVTLDDLIAMLRDKGDEGDMERLEEYRKKYLASD